MFIKAAGKDLGSVRAELLAHYPVFDPKAGKPKAGQSELKHEPQPEMDQHTYKT